VKYLGSHFVMDNKNNNIDVENIKIDIETTENIEMDIDSKKRKIDIDSERRKIDIDSKKRKMWVDSSDMN
ncbi:5880_t:CDS:2, partial [Cetraspora pellucida]